MSVRKVFKAHQKEAVLLRPARRWQKVLEHGAQPNRSPLSVGIRSQTPCLRATLNPRLDHVQFCRPFVAERHADGYVTC